MNMSIFVNRGGGRYLGYGVGRWHNESESHKSSECPQIPEYSNHGIWSRDRSMTVKHGFARSQVKANWLNNRRRLGGVWVLKYHNLWISDLKILNSWIKSWHPIDMTLSQVLIMKCINIRYFCYKCHISDIMAKDRRVWTQKKYQWSKGLMSSDI